MFYILAFLLGAAVTSVSMMLYMQHINRVIRRETQLYLIQNDMDPALVDEKAEWLPNKWPYK